MAHLEGAEQTLVHAHHRARIVELAAVVGCAEERNELPLGEELVAVLYDLMGSANQIHVVLLKEALDNIGPKGEGHASVVLAPASDVFVRIRPEEIAEETAIGNLCQSVSVITEIKDHACCLHQ
jgi:hypothetical protein